MTYKHHDKEFDEDSQIQLKTLKKASKWTWSYDYFDKRPLIYLNFWEQYKMYPSSKINKVFNRSSQSSFSEWSLLWCYHMS